MLALQAQGRDDVGRELRDVEPLSTIEPSANDDHARISAIIADAVVVRIRPPRVVTGCGVEHGSTHRLSVSQARSWTNIGR